MSGVATGRDALRRVRKCFALAVVALCVAASAFAETVAERWTFVKTGNNDGNYAYSNAWKDSDGVSRTWTAETSAEQIDYIIPKGYTFNMNYGGTDETEFMLPQNTDSTVTLYGTIQVMWIHTTIPNLVMKDSSKIYLHLARNAASNFRKPRRVSGSARIDASDSAPAIFDTWGYHANQMQTNAMIMTGSGAIRYTHTPRDDNKDGQIVVTGDNSGFTGPVSILKSGTAANKNMHLYVSSSENIGGNPATFKEKGLEINGAYLHIQGDTALGENRGFYVSGDSSTVDVSSGATFTVPTEIGFADGGYTLAKTGAGTMKVPGWSADGAVSLASGTLEITGASVANGTVTPVSIGSLSVSNGTNLRVVLSGDGSELAVGRYTILSSVSLPDNIDSFLTVVNAGAFTLPDGKADSYSVDKNGNLVMTVAEHWTFVNTSSSSDGNYAFANAWTNSFGTYKTWTDATSAEQIDYIIPQGRTFITSVGDINEAEFMLPQNSDSTVTLYGKIDIRWIHTTIPQLVMKDSSRLHLWIARNAGSNFRRPRRVSGSARIDAADAAPAIFDTFAYAQNQMQTNAMTMTGSGAIRYTHDPRSDNIHGQIVVTGDNSGFTGSVSIYKSGTNANRNMHMYVSSSENIGGNPATFKEKGLEINGAYLHVQGDTALGENRGFYVSGDSSTVDVSSGATFTVPTVVGFANGGYTLTKSGAGTMKVPGWTTGKVAVNAGALNLVGVTFANGAAGTPVAIGGIEYSSGATVTLAVEGDGSELPMADATNVLLVAESALPVDFADKVQLVGGDSAYTVPSRLKTRLVVVDGTKLALETEKSRGFVLIVK